MCFIHADIYIKDLMLTIAVTMLDNINFIKMKTLKKYLKHNSSNSTSFQSKFNSFS